MSSVQVANAANITPVLVKKGSSQVNAWFIANTKGALRHLKLYNAASASDVVVGTTPPEVVIPVPSAGYSQAQGVAFQFPLGIVMVTTTGVLDTDVAAGTARDIVGHLTYGAPGKC